MMQIYHSRCEISPQGMKHYGRDRGSAIMGTNGTAVVDRDAYEIYDLKGKKTGESNVGGDIIFLVGRDSVTDAHVAKFIPGIRKGEKLSAPVSAGNIAVTKLHLSNIAWESTGNCILTRRTREFRTIRKP